MVFKGRAGLVSSRGVSQRGEPVKIATTLLLTFAVALVACSAKQATRPPERASAKQPYDFEKEGTVPPPEKPAPAPETDVEEIPVEEADIVGEDVAAPRDTTKATRRGPEAVQGRDGTVNIMVFRVQVLATTSERSALETKRKIENRLGLATYVALEEGMYKVRVSDCSTRESAEKVRNQLRGAGYTDAWIVRDSLRSPPPPDEPTD